MNEAAWVIVRAWLLARIVFYTFTVGYQKSHLLTIPRPPAADQKREISDTREPCAVTVPVVHNMAYNGRVQLFSHVSS